MKRQLFEAAENRTVEALRPQKKTPGKNLSLKVSDVVSFINWNPYYFLLCCCMGRTCSTCILPTKLIGDLYFPQPPLISMKFLVTRKRISQIPKNQRPRPHHQGVVRRPLGVGNFLLRIGVVKVQPRLMTSAVDDGDLRNSQKNLWEVDRRTGWFQTFFMFIPILGKWCNLTSIFFRWVVQPPTRDVGW